MVEWFKIVGLGIVAAIGYGIVHDSITTRICVEYFTIGHPPIFGGLTSPTALALGWGVLATWWVGMGLGVFLACAARVGSKPPLGARDLLRPLAVLLVVMAFAATLAGMTGFEAARRGAIELFEPMASAIAPEKHAAFLADLWAHLTSYATAFVGGLILAVWVTIRRHRLAHLPRPPRTDRTDLNLA